MSTSRLLAIEPLLDEIADRVAARILKAQARMVSQTSSELGARRHRAAVRRRLDEGLDGAAIVGRRFLLTPEALREEATRVSAPRRQSKPNAVAKATKTAKGGKGEPARETLSEFQRELLAGLRSLQRKDNE